MDEAPHSATPTTFQRFPRLCFYAYGGELGLGEKNDGRLAASENCQKNGEKTAGMETYLQRGKEFHCALPRKRVGDTQISEDLGPIFSWNGHVVREAFGIWVLYHTRMNIICNMIVWYILLYYIYISQYILDIMMTSCEEVVSISEILPTTTLFNDWSEILICVWHIMSSPGIKTCIDSPRFTWISLLQLRPEKRPAAQTLLGIQVIQHLQAARLALCQIEKTNWPTTRLVKWCWKWHQSNWPQKNLPTYLNMYPRHEFFFPRLSMPWMRMARTASEGERLATQILAGLETLVEKPIG